MGSCVHVAGIMNFLNLAKDAGYATHFLGTAVPVEKLVQQIEKEEPDIVAVSYRLTPEVGKTLLVSLKTRVDQKGFDKTSFVFGGTRPVAEIAADLGFFDAIFSPESKASEIAAYLCSQEPTLAKDTMPQDVISRIKYKRPYPLLRHHYGRPSLEETVTGVKEISEAEVLDVVSLGPDQSAQQFFFHPEKMDPTQSGAGGVPVRTAKDLKRLYEATRCGNYPLMRCYSGTNDLIEMADLLQKTIHNAWAAIPLCWYNVLDGRSERGVEQSISDNLAAVEWHAKRDVPVEINESHHWSLREAHDTIAITAAYLAAYNAKKRGVKNYISQYMLNTPARTSHLMDVAKMLAQIELVESLHDDSFASFREFRAGLFSFPENLEKAKGQLAASTYLAMAMRPDIYHVVGYCESHHAVMLSEVIESCNIVQQVIDVCIKDMPDLTLDPRVKERKAELLDEAKLLVAAFSEIAPSGVDDPLSDARTIAKAIRIGLLDAPHLAGNPNAKGTLITREKNGSYYAFDPVANRTVAEKERIGKILSESKNTSAGVS